MFDFGFSELLLIGVIALVVLGPERLPKAARMAGQLVGRVQRMVGSVKQELSSQLEMDELRRAKDEFEATAHSVRDEIAGIGAQRVRQRVKFQDASGHLVQQGTVV